MQLADTLLALFVLCAALAGAASLQESSRALDEAAAAAWQMETISRAARALPDVPDGALSVPGDLPSLPPGFSDKTSDGRPLAVYVRKTDGGRDVLVLAQGGNAALSRAAALHLKGGFYRPSDRRAQALGLASSDVWQPARNRKLSLASFGIASVPAGSYGALDGAAAAFDTLREELLRRTPLDGHSELSVMETDLHLNGHALENASALSFLNTYSGPACAIKGFNLPPETEAYDGPAATPAALCADKANDGRLVLDARFGFGLCRNGRFALVHDSRNSLDVRGMGVTEAVSVTNNGGATASAGTIPVPDCGEGASPAVFFSPMRTGQAVPWIPKACLADLASSDSQREALARLPAQYFRTAGVSLMRSAVSRQGSVWKLVVNVIPDTLAMRQSGATLRKNSPDLAAAQDLIAAWYQASGQVSRPSGSTAPLSLPASCPFPGLDRPVPFAWFTACITEAAP